MIIKDNSGQVSAELILLIAGIIVVVVSAVTMYKDYLIDFGSEINDTEVNEMINKIDKINEKLK